MKKYFKKLASLMLTTALSVTMMPLGNIVESEKVQAATLSNPRIVSDSSMEAGQKVTYDCIWFGSYPQSEVVPSGEYEALDNLLLQDGDIIVSDNTYNELQNATGWDDNGDITLKGQKYRRIKKGDATSSEWSGNEDYYYWSDFFTYHYFKYKPIKWRVLSVNGNDAFLLADKALDDQRYNALYASVTWDTSTIRSWLNGYGALSNAYGTDYSNKNFIDTAFSGVEQSAVKTALVINNDNIVYGTECGSNTNDKVFLLSTSEVNTDNAESYGFVSSFITYDEARRSKSSTYAKAMGTWSDTDSPYAECSWWLRLARSNMLEAAYVSEDGYVHEYGVSVERDKLAIRPALHLDLSSTDVYSYAGTVCSDGTVNEEKSSIMPGEDKNDNIVLPPTCSLKAEENGSIDVSVSAESLVELKKLTEDINWTIEDSSILHLENSGFILPSNSENTLLDGATKNIWKAHGKVKVAGLKPGITKLVGKTSDGGSVICEVTVEEADSTIDKIDDWFLSLGENKKFNVGGGVGEFFPDTWSLKMNSIPIEVSKEKNDDGTYKIKGQIGLGRSNLLDKDTEWKNFKNQIEDLQKYGEKLNNIDKIMAKNKLKAYSFVTPSKFKKKPEVNVVGYVEVTYDKNGKVIKQEGKVALGAKWKGSVDWQFVTPIGPVYLELKGEAKASGNVDINIGDGAVKKVSVSFGKATVTPSVTIEGGYGVKKIACIGAQGQASFPITFLPWGKVDFKAKASIHVNVIFVLDKTYDLASYSKNLFSTTSSLSKNSILQKNYFNSSNDKWKLIDTEFAKHTTEWNGKSNQKKNKAISKQKSIQQNRANDSEIILQEGILSASIPIQREIDGKKVIVFQTYDSTKDTLNSTVIKYSVYDNGQWSTPKAVWDNGCADMFSDMKVVNGKLILAWQKEKTKILGDVEQNSSNVFDNISRNSEICYAEFDSDSNTFINQQYITNNEEYDLMPYICENTDNVAISYVRNSANSIMQENGDNKIYTAIYNGKEFNEQEVTTSVGTVEEYVTYMLEDEVKALYVTEQNGMTAVYGSDGQMIEKLSDLLMYSEDGTVSSLNYHNGIIDIISNGTLYQYDAINDECTTSLAGENSFGSNVYYCSNGSKSAYLWSQYDEETKKGQLYVSMKNEDGYSEPIVLFEEDNKIVRYASPILDEQGNWHIVMNLYDAETGLNSFVYIDKKESASIELIGASVDENNQKDGLTAINYYATNDSDSQIDTLKLKISLENGDVIENDIHVNIEPGESVADTIYVDLSGATESQKANILIYADNQTDVSNNLVSEIVGKTDIELMERHEENDGKINITAYVRNNGTNSATTPIVLYGDENKSNILYSSEEMTLAPGESKTVVISVDKKGLSYNEKNAIYLMLEASSSNDDYNTDNNIQYIVFYKSQNQQTTTTSLNSVKDTTKKVDSNIKHTQGTVVKKPSVTKIRKIKKVKKSLKVSWKKVKNVNGYEIQYSTSSKFKKAKKITIKKAKTTSKVIKKLKVKKKYYVRIRTYIVVNGAKKYSNWSKKKSQKTK